MQVATLSIRTRLGAELFQVMGKRSAGTKVRLVYFRTESECYLIDSERYMTSVVSLHRICVGYFHATFRKLALSSSSYCRMF